MNATTVKLIVDILTVCGIITTFIFNIINLKKVLKDNEPQLCFDLRKNRGALFLTIKNTGKTKATNIKVNIQKIHNNGEKGLKEDFIFNIPFELSANEQLQGIVAEFGGNYQNNVFPYLDVEVSYLKPHSRKSQYYKRQIFYNPQTVNAYDNVSEQLLTISKELDDLKKPVLRLANYFDGHQVAPFDEINFITDRNFQSDLFNVVVKNENEGSISREDTIKARLR